MFDRFTHGAKAAVVLAQESARMLNHNYIGTEHLLMAIAHPKSGEAGTVLADHGITGDAVQASITGIVGLGQSAHEGHLRMTPRARAAVAAAASEAIALGSSEITPVHLLLALLRPAPDDRTSVCQQVLMDLGANPARLSQDTMNAAAGTDTDAAVRRALEAFQGALGQAVDAPAERLAEAMRAALNAARMTTAA